MLARIKGASNIRKTAWWRQAWWMQAKVVRHQGDTIWRPQGKRRLVRVRVRVRKAAGKRRLVRVRVRVRNAAGKRRLGTTCLRFD